MIRFKPSIDPLPPISEMNMTPLMDLSYLLLVTFIITFPLVEQGIQVNLPMGKAPRLEQRDSRTVSVDAKGNVYLDNSMISLDQLSADMSAIGGTASDTTVYVRGDKGVDYGSVAKVIEILHEANISKVALVTHGEQDKRAK